HDVVGASSSAGGRGRHRADRTRVATPCVQCQLRSRRRWQGRRDRSRDRAALALPATGTEWAPKDPGRREWRDAARRCKRCGARRSPKRQPHPSPPEVMRSRESVQREDPGLRWYNRSRRCRMTKHPQPESHELVHRTCPLCEAKCGISVEVDRGAKRVVTVRGDEADSFSQGYLCPKAYGLKGLHEDPDRLCQPLRRDGSSWREIGWEEAFALATQRLRSIRDANGADAIATYLRNPHAPDVGSALYLPAFQRALGTRWRFSATSVDQLPKAMSSCLLFGSPAAFPIPDVDRTDFLLVLGANPLVSNGSLMTAPDMPRRLAQLRARGGTLVVVDPRRSETARIADQHLFIRPGADAFFLFALVHVLFAEKLVAL